jgi:hypothetical protein
MRLLGRRRLGTMKIALMCSPVFGTGASGGSQSDLKLRQNIAVMIRDSVGLSRSVQGLNVFFEESE